MAGVLVGSYIWGHLSDVIGRLKAIYISMALGIAAGFASSFSTSIYMYALLRFVVGINQAGYGLASYVLAVEVVGPSKRYLMGNVAAIFFGIEIYCNF